MTGAPCYKQLMSGDGASKKATYDVFFSHNKADSRIVRRIGERLRNRGVTVWLDEWSLVPGRSWQEALEQVITTTQSAAVFLGSSGLGPWENVEMKACLRQFVQRDLPVVPVLLPGASSQQALPTFLADLTAVDMRTGLTEDTLDQLEWGITGNIPETAHNIIAHTAKILAATPGQDNQGSDSAPSVAGALSIRDTLIHTFKAISEAAERGFQYVGIPTMLHALDRALGGLQRGELVVISGTPGSGKTTLALNILSNAAVIATNPSPPPELLPKLTVAYFSEEGTATELGARLVCMEAKLDSNRLRTGWMSADDWACITSAATHLVHRSIFIDDSITLDLQTISKRIAELQSVAKSHESELALIVVDSLQAIPRTTTPWRAVDPATACQSLRRAARKYNVVVVLVNELPRRLRHARHPEHELTEHLMATAPIHNRCDIHLVIRDSAVAHLADRAEPVQVEVTVAKQRFGPMTTVRLRFDAASGLWSDDDFDDTVFDLSDTEQSNEAANEEDDRQLLLLDGTASDQGGSST